METSFCSGRFQELRFPNGCYAFNLNLHFVKDCPAVQSLPSKGISIYPRLGTQAFTARFSFLHFLRSRCPDWTELRRNKEIHPLKPNPITPNGLCSMGTFMTRIQRPSISYLFHNS